MPIIAVEHIRPMKGGAQSQLMRASDRHFYVVKFVNNPQHSRVLANELLTARLAKALDLPVPEPAIIRVPEELIASSPAMVIRYSGQVVRCAAGLQFGSRLPARDPNVPIFDYLPEAALELVSNLEIFAAILLFDKWTCNCNGRQAVFCRPSVNRPLKMYMIDQGFCFNAGEWTFPDSALRGIYSRNVVYRGIRGWASFEPQLGKLEALDPELVYRAAEEIPQHWYGDIADLERLVEQLVARRKIVRRLIEEVKRSPRAPFENWN